MSEEVHPHSLLGRIMALVPDPRGRRGRRFPLGGIVAMLLLGALEGEGSLRGDVAPGQEVLGGPGRKIGPALAALRDGALNLIRGLGYRYVPDAWRAFSVPSGRLLHCLLAPL